MKHPSPYPAPNSFKDIFDVSNTESKAQDSSETLKAVLDSAKVVESKQKDYQPIYGLEQDDKPRPRLKLLRQDCDIVIKEFSQVLRKDQIRILDLGCNAGYVSFVLAEVFPSVVGFDINPENIALCRAIKAHTGSPAQFYAYDLLDMVDSGKADLENLDCVLLLNVVHQLIFAKGIPYVKKFIARLAEEVDFIVVELAPRRDYVPHGKDRELPLVPAEILELCTNSIITLVHEGRRPVYTIRRRQLAVGDRKVEFNDRKFSLHKDPRVNRKYYYGSNTFTKMIRYTSFQGPRKYHLELSGLQALDGLDVSPKPLAWDSDDISGRVCMERFYGVSLSDIIPKLSPEEKPSHLAEITRIAAVLAEKSLYHYDFASHNLILLSDGSLRLIDLEQSGKAPVRDSFGAFLWLVNDIMKGDREYYRRSVAAKLVLAKGETRVDPSVYPELDSVEVEQTFGDALADIIAKARNTTLSWNDFIREAALQLNPR